MDGRNDSPQYMIYTSELGCIFYCDHINAVFDHTNYAAIAAMTTTNRTLLFIGDGMACFTKSDIGPQFIQSVCKGDSFIFILFYQMEHQTQSSFLTDARELGYFVYSVFD